MTLTYAAFANLLLVSACPLARLDSSTQALLCVVLCSTVSGITLSLFLGNAYLSSILLVFAGQALLALALTTVARRTSNALWFLIAWTLLPMLAADWLAQWQAVEATRLLLTLNPVCYLAALSGWDNLFYTTLVYNHTPFADLRIDHIEPLWLSLIMLSFLSFNGLVLLRSLRIAKLKHTPQSRTSL
ncbi:MAG: hypothetical protein AAF529_04845 [Pseudomonadota bacterium]